MKSAIAAGFEHVAESTIKATLEHAAPQSPYPTAVSQAAFSLTLTHVLSFNPPPSLSLARSLAGACKAGRASSVACPSAFPRHSLPLGCVFLVVMRLLFVAGIELRLSTWQPILLAAMIVAQKVGSPRAKGQSETRPAPWVCAAIY
eukprot:6214563-Pleurochrysis_carterae.AAC.1